MYKLFSLPDTNCLTISELSNTVLEDKFTLSQLQERC